MLQKMQLASYHRWKRCFDIILSSILLLILSPVMLLLSVIICCSSKGPVIYRHHRLGKNGVPISIYKFRTMIADADKRFDLFSATQYEEWKKNYKLEDDPRVTMIGRFLRKSSLDELPQLVNVIKGELSLVGPRPVIEEEAELYGSNRDKFLSITPGLTGYWQAYARSDCSYEQRMRMELYYIDHQSLGWDIKILFATVTRVLSGKGAK